MKNYYEVLGLDQNASKEDIKSAYRKLARKLHPDRNGENNFYSTAFKELNEANKVLSNDDQRAEYDFQLRSQETHRINFQLAMQDLKNRKSNKISGVRSNLKKIALVFLGLIALSLVITKAFDAKEGEVQSQASTLEIDIESEVLKESLEIKSNEAEINIARNPTSVSSVDNIRAPQEKLKAVTKQKLLEKRDDARSLRPEADEKEIVFDDRIKARIIETLNTRMGNCYNAANCVTVCRTKSSNLSSEANITAFLKSKGYSISGRQLSNERIAGVKAEANGPCMKLVIGSF